MTGERFEFQTSARVGDGVFRFRWTLAPGKKGPPEHVHDDESETFEIVSGVLRIWIDKQPRDLHPGDRVTVPPLVRHRFFNPGTEPVVVDVSLDGPRMEDALVPFAYYAAGRTKLSFGDFTRMMVHSIEIRPSRPPSRVLTSVFTGLGRLFKLFGVKPLARVERWSRSGDPALLHGAAPP